MRTLDQWFDEYAVSHQNPTNKAIHYICVPAIYFSIVGLLMSIPSGFIANTLKLNAPIIENWAVVVLLFVLVFYIRLSVIMAIKIAVFSAICLVVNYYIGQFVPLWAFSIGVFVIAWIGQFYGHNIEGKKPSFLKDLQFLMIGPAWVVENLFSGKKIS
ncbi:putative membrane protein YGL010W [Flavobacterium chryseum]|uniref:Mpo1 family 2-hydroxy fatty acid dioxygenase n=1 Tax=Flavobacterium sp. P3160 TaxID=2512113 RepID=UPI00105F6AD7|nr:Mpo1-like protein [Flavobacterium sp. P3160]TDO77812.1 putative membrane protein YGL010W [Flavobacterium sp. P3160]